MQLVCKILEMKWKRNENIAPASCLQIANSHIWETRIRKKHFCSKNDSFYRVIITSCILLIKFPSKGCEAPSSSPSNQTNKRPPARRMTSVKEQMAGRVPSWSSTDGFKWGKQPGYPIFIKTLGVWELTGGEWRAGQSTRATSPAPLPPIRWRERTWWWILMERFYHQNLTLQEGGLMARSQSFWISMRGNDFSLCYYEFLVGMCRYKLYLFDSTWPFTFGWHTLWGRSEHFHGSCTDVTWKQTDREAFIHINNPSSLSDNQQTCI